MDGDWAMRYPERDNDPFFGEPAGKADSPSARLDRLIGGVNELADMALGLNDVNAELRAERDRYKAALELFYRENFEDWITEEKPTFEEWLERVLVRAGNSRESDG